VYLPVGSKVVLNESLSNKIRRISFYDCRNEYHEDDLKNTEWIMRNSGLSCAPNFEFHEGGMSDSDMDELKRDIEESVKEAQKEARKAEKEAQKEAKRVEKEAIKMAREIQKQHEN